MNWDDELELCSEEVEYWEACVKTDKEQLKDSKICLEEAKSELRRVIHATKGKK